jgi:molecular chaperone GrpE
MSKKSNDQTIPEPDTSAQSDNQSQTEIHVESHSESHVSSGGGSFGAGDESDRIEELTSDLKRLQAEFANYRRRAESERAEVLDFAKTRVVREFLAVRDNFDRELANRPADVKPAWATSIDAIRTQFDQVLKALGVERFDSKGQPFDPHLHEAIAIEDGEGTHEIVTEELQPGYKLGQSKLRHAIVKVGKTTEPPTESKPAEPITPPADSESEPDNSEGSVK